MAFRNGLSFVVKPGAPERCGRKGIYLLSVRMNKAFHHLAAVLEWALDETPPSLAPRSPVRGGSSSFFPGEDFFFTSKMQLLPIFSCWGTFGSLFQKCQLWRSFSVQQHCKLVLMCKRCDSAWTRVNELGLFDATVSFAKCYLYQNTDVDPLAQAGTGVKVRGLLEHRIKSAVLWNARKNQLDLITLRTSVKLKFHFRLKVLKRRAILRSAKSSWTMWLHCKSVKDLHFKSSLRRWNSLQGCLRLHARGCLFHLRVDFTSIR